MMRTLLLLCALAVGCSAAPHPAPGRAPALKPPVAPRHPKRIEQHGETRIDDYGWLRDKDSPEVVAYLKAENAYSDALIAPTAALREQLYAEIVGRIQETDQSAPVRLGEYLYYSRTFAGRQYELHARKRGSLDAPEEVLLDLNRMAEGE